jgi:hypothetical protein
MIWYLIVHSLISVSPNTPAQPTWTRLGPYTYETCDKYAQELLAQKKLILLSEPVCEMEPIPE